jgi:hypothetical protein
MGLLCWLALQGILRLKLQCRNTDVVA